MYIKYTGAQSLHGLPSDLKKKAAGCNGHGGCEWERLQSNAFWVYEHYFASDVRIITGLLELLGRRIRGFKSPVKLTDGAFRTAPGFCKMGELEAKLEARGNVAPQWGLPVDQECVDGGILSKTPAKNTGKFKDESGGKSKDQSAERPFLAQEPVLKITSSDVADTPLTISNPEPGLPSMEGDASQTIDSSEHEAAAPTVLLHRIQQPMMLIQPESRQQYLILVTFSLLCFASLYLSRRRRCFPCC